MLTVEPLRACQYRQLAEWEWPAEDIDLDGYAALLESSNRLNFGVYRDGRFCASISLEKLGNVARFHVAKERRAIHPQDLAGLLITMADYCFHHSIEEIEAAFPVTNRAARRLAIRCWMMPKGEFQAGGITFQVYAMTRADYYGRAKIEAYQNSISAE